MNFSTPGLIESRRNRTVPSPMAAFTPPVWNENGSSFGPQLLVPHGQVVGPPTGLGLLLILATRLPLELFGPDTPLVAASASAQANTRRAAAAGDDIELAGL